MFKAIQREIQSGSPCSVKELCELAGVSRSGYYRWISSRDAYEARQLRDIEDFRLIREAYDFRGYAKGYRSICMRLKRMGTPMNHKKVLRLMNKFGLKCPVRKANPYRRMARELKTDTVFRNYVNREFRKHGPRKILLTDITYIRLKNEFCYLSVIKDAYTMQILAYRLSESLEVDFVLDTVNQLLSKHKCSLDDETIIHSDQGCHYTSVAFRTLVSNSSLRQSMSRKGNCWDNAPQESFFGHMKDELKTYAKSWETFDDVKERIDDWMDYYNNDRYQTILNGMSPNEFYKNLELNNAHDVTI